jgi:hypothetical protein
LRDEDEDEGKLPGSNANGITPLSHHPPSLVPPLRYAFLIIPLILAPIPFSSAITHSPNANIGQTPPVNPTPLVPSTEHNGRGSAPRTRNASVDASVAAGQ